MISTGTELPTNGEIMVSLPYSFDADFELRSSRGKLIPIGVQVQEMNLEEHTTKTRVARVSPQKPLDSKARYTVVLKTKREHPTRIVVGTFVTSERKDDVAPRFQAPRGVTAFASGHYRCRIDRWLEVELEDARDSGPFYYVVSIAKEKEPMPTLPQWRIERPSGHRLTVRSPYCGSEDYPYVPGLYRLRVAAVDEAGNQSRAYEVPFSVP